MKSTAPIQGPRQTQQLTLV